MKNEYGKSRPESKPYFVIIKGSWEWRVLKLYKSPAASLKDPYARAFCTVSSPMTFGGCDMGDVYVNDIPGFREKLREVAEESAPVASKRSADRIDGYDRDDLGESHDY
jgi:hypothetical protein